MCGFKVDTQKVHTVFRTGELYYFGATLLALYIVS